MATTTHWIITADGRGAHLFGCSHLPSGDLHLEPGRSLHNAHEEEHERNRPLLLGGAERRGSVARSGAHAAPHVVSQGHADEESLRRFAREVRTWLAAAIDELGTERVTLFAAPQFLGVLRTELDAVASRVDLHKGELTHLRAHELAAHPEIRRMFPAAPSAAKS